MTGEIISILVAMAWTVTAMVSEVASKRLGVTAFNVWRLALALLCSIVVSLCFSGSLMPQYADAQTWMWMLLSGFVGYFLGDWCLFNSYILIGSRYGQLFMTLAPAASAISAWLLLGEKMSWMAVLAMLIVMTGIAISIGGTLRQSGDDAKHEASLSKNGIGLGVLFAIGAAVGQGVGLVISKVGMEHYQECIPATAYDSLSDIIPFNANLIRCVAGVLCFSLWTFVRRKQQNLLIPFHDRKSMASILTAVCFGPFLGVAFSLMAVRYTQAGIAQTLMAVTPIMILLPSWWFFHQKITIGNIIGAIVSVIGAALFFV